MAPRLPGKAALRTCAWGALPACAAVLASFGGGAGPERLFRADAAGLAVGIAVAAFAAVDLRLLALRVVVVAMGLVLAHAAVAAAAAASALGIAVLSLGTSLAALGLSSFGHRVGTPRVAAGAVAAGVLWAACQGVWWADRLAASVPIEARTAVRQAVLDIDPFTAAANGAGFDRMHATTLYAETTVATVPLELPTPVETAAWWGGLGTILLAASRLGVARRMDAPPVGVGAPS